MSTTRPPTRRQHQPAEQRHRRGPRRPAGAGRTGPLALRRLRLAAAGAARAAGEYAAVSSAQPVRRRLLIAMPPNARWRTGRRRTPSARPTARAPAAAHGDARSATPQSQMLEREQHDQEARQRHQRLRAHRVGERQRQRGDHVGAVGERERAQPRPRRPGWPRAGRRAASGCVRRSRTGCPPAIGK